MVTTVNILYDGLCAAVAAVGFASISNPPRRAYLVCAALAAVGHMTRYCLMNGAGMHLTPASLVASVAIGLLALCVARWTRCPAEVFSFPAILPMVPGMYAYRTIQATIRCLSNIGEADFMHQFYLLNYNWITCIMTIVVMVVGVTVPLILIDKRLPSPLKKIHRLWNYAN